MKWFEYKAEVDALHAPEELKEKLRAMQHEQQPAKPARVFPGWKRLTGMAACFVCGAVTVLAAGGVLLGGFAMGGASAADNATAAVTGGTKPGVQSSTAESGRDLYGAVDMGLLSDSVMFDAAEQREPGSGSVKDSSNNAAATLVNDVNRELEIDATQTEQADSKVLGRKIVYTAHLTLETTDYDATLAALHETLNALGGYVEHSENRNYGTDRRWVQYVLRVPAAAYGEFMTAAEDSGSLINKTEDSEDITAQYVDVTARIDTLLQQRARLQQLSAQAESLYDLLEIEEKLANVQYQLESWQRQLAAFDDRVDYCTVTVEVQEVTVYTPVQPTAGERMSRALSRGFEDFADTLFDLVLWVLRNLSWIAVFAVAALAGRILWKKRGGKRG